MTSTTVKLAKDGNSVAVRLPKTVLALSGLHGTVHMDVKRGQITLRNTRTPRAGWEGQIAHIIATDPKALADDEELDDWEVTISDGLEKN